MEIIARIAQEFEISPAIAQRVAELLDEGNTVPFIARDRKEQTGAMDDQKLRELSERLDYLRSMDKRREQIESAIAEQGKLTEEIRLALGQAQDDQKLRELSERLDYLRSMDKRREQIESAIAEQGKLTEEIRLALGQAQTLASLEDIYRPFKPKRRTRAMIAREKGVEPLARAIMAQRRNDEPLALAAAYVDAEKGVPDAETAIRLAQDVIAEEISDDASIRASLRALVKRSGVLRSVQAKEGENVYGQYAD